MWGQLDIGANFFCQVSVKLTGGPSPNHPNVASVAGRRRRSAESAWAAGPRRWVGPRDGCVRGMRTGVNRLRVPAGGVGHTAPICARAHATQLWYLLTGVCLVRHTSVDLRGDVDSLGPCRARGACAGVCHLCVCVFITAVPMKKLFAWGDWCVCAPFNYFALVLSLYSSTGVAAQQVFAAENSGVSLLGKQSILEPLI